MTSAQSSFVSLVAGSQDIDSEESKEHDINNMEHDKNDTAVFESTIRWEHDVWRGLGAFSWEKVVLFDLVFLTTAKPASVRGVPWGGWGFWAFSLGSSDLHPGAFAQMSSDFGDLARDSEREC